MKNNTGITLIALIITIIVLMILAGVAITSITGENSLMQKASYDVTETEKTQIEEELKLQLQQALIDTQLDYESIGMDHIYDKLMLTDTFMNDDMFSEVTGGDSENNIPITGVYKGYNYSIIASDDGKSFTLELGEKVN